MTPSGLRRAFVAVVPPADVLDELERAVASARDAATGGLSWSRRAQWHLTLQFLGPVHDVDPLVETITAAAASVRPCTTRLGGAGAFPSTSRASVVWVGVDEGVDEMSELASLIAAATAPLGFDADGRPFTPHLTVARARRPLPVTATLAAIGAGPFGRSWEVGEIVVFESDTRPSGAVYREVAVVSLAGH